MVLGACASLLHAGTGRHMWSCCIPVLLAGLRAHRRTGCNIVACTSAVAAQQLRLFRLADVLDLCDGLACGLHMSRLELVSCKQCGNMPLGVGSEDMDAQT